MTDWDGVERRVRKRRVKRVYRFIDRRRGFDRRKRHPILGTMRDHHWILVFVLVTLNLMSVLDGYFTAAELGLGIASEGNPVLDAIARRSPLLAIAVKVGVMLVVSVIIWRGRRRRVFLLLSLVSLVVFAALLAFHFGSLHGLGWL